MEARGKQDGRTRSAILIITRRHAHSAYIHKKTHSRDEALCEPPEDSTPTPASPTLISEAMLQLPGAGAVSILIVNLANSTAEAGRREDNG